MTLHIEKAGPVFYVKDETGNILGRHKTRAEAQAQIYTMQMKERFGK